MRTTALRNTLLALAAVAMLVPATADAQVHRQALDYQRGGRGEREVINRLRALEDAARAFNRSSGDQWAFERLADTYFAAGDALSRVRYRAHVYGGFNRIDQLMDEMFDRYGYRDRRFSNDRLRDRDRDRFRDRPRDRWRY